MSSKLQRHEAAQRHSRALREAQGAVTLSFSTREVVDYLAAYPAQLGGSREVVAVEIKTGKSHLSARQKQWVKKPALDTYVEHWVFVNGFWALKKVDEYLVVNRRNGRPREIDLLVANG